MTFPRLGLSARLSLLIITVLLISQAINVTILVQAQRHLRQERFQAVLAERVVQSARIIEVSPRGARRLSRRRGLTVLPEPPETGQPVPAMEAALRDALEEQGYADRAARALLVDRGKRPVVTASVQLANGAWLHQRMPLPPSTNPPWRPIVAQTALLTAFLLLPALWVGRRVARPLRDLTAAADGLLTGKSAPPLPQGGPPDVQALSRALGALEGRILTALEEKSMMLGAIGHDLRTPLASLRIRVEAVENEGLREDMIASLDQLTITLDDILSFSKATSHEGREDVRTDALLKHLAGAYDPSVLKLTSSPVLTVRCAPEAVLRALRNLIDNAVRHSEQVDVAVEARQDTAVFIVGDRGPGIPTAQIERLQKPFQRADASRNRESGGAGLGLPIARAVAEAHQGRLVLRARDGGGLQAELHLPTHLTTGDEAPSRTE